MVCLRGDPSGCSRLTRSGDRSPARGTRGVLHLSYSVGQLFLRPLDMSPGQRAPSLRSLTRDDWQRVEAILTQATRLSDAEGIALIDSAPLDAPLRREITDLFHLSGPHGLEETRTADVRGPSPAPATGAAFQTRRLARGRQVRDRPADRPRGHGHGIPGARHGAGHAGRPENQRSSDPAAIQKLR